jgi:O-antigen/teichoic acid export membrane protein
MANHLGRLNAVLKSDLLKGVMRVGGLLIAGQAFYFSITPILTRLFTPEDFGVFGLVYSFVGLASVLVCMNFDMAIPMAKDDNSALKLVSATGLIAMVVSLLSGVVLLFFTWLGWFGFDNLGSLMIVAAAATILLQGGFQIMQAWHMRTENAPQLGLSHFNINAGRGTAQVGFGLAGLGGFGLMAGEIAGRLLSVVMLARDPWKAFREKSGRYQLVDLRESLSGNGKLFSVLLPAQTVDAAVPLAILASITALYGPTIAGQFFLMRRILEVPISLIFRAVADLFYGRISSMARFEPERIRPFLRSTVLLIALAAAIVLVPLLFFGPWLLRVGLGEEWHLAGVMMTFMLPATALNIAVAPVTRVFAITTRPKLRWVYTATYVTLISAVLAAALVLNLNILTLVACISAATALSFVVYFFTADIAAAHLNAPE